MEHMMQQSERKTKTPSEHQLLVIKGRGLENEWMTVYVKAITGKKISVKCTPEDMVGLMMQQSEEKTHLVSKGES